MRECLVRKQIAGRVGNDELVLAFAIADCIRRLVLVLDQANDLKLDLATVRRLDNEGLAQLERFAIRRRRGLTVSVVRAYGGPPISVQIAFDVCVVFPKRPRECVVTVPFIDVVVVIRSCRIQRP